MTNETKLTYKIRYNNLQRKEVVAPYINGYNVWELDQGNWNDDVKSAILHAYELGRRDVLKEIQTTISGNILINAKKLPALKCELWELE